MNELSKTSRNGRFSINRSIFKRASSTYYYSSLFFPSAIKQDIFTLYAFVRTADDLVDCIPPKREEFRAYQRETIEALKGSTAHNPRIQDLVDLVHKKNIEPQWIIDFLKAMESDLSPKSYQTYEDLQTYIYGSAEVIGLCMCAILGVSRQAYASARAQGEAMQLINFIRDIHEDELLGRTYIPKDDCKQFGVNYPLTQSNRPNFEKLVRFEISRYREIQTKAQAGYSYLPRRVRFVIKTASDMYMWTADQIDANPKVVFKRKVRPSRSYVLFKGVMNAIQICFTRT